MSCRYDYILNNYQGNVRAVVSQNGVTSKPGNLDEIFEK